MVIEGQLIGELNSAKTQRKGIQDELKDLITNQSRKILALRFERHQS